MHCVWNRKAPCHHTCWTTLISQAFATIAFLTNLWHRSTAANLSAVIGPDSKLRHFRFNQHSVADCHSEACSTFVVQVGVTVLLQPSLFSVLRGPDCECEWQCQLEDAVQSTDSEHVTLEVEIQKQINICGRSILMMTDPVVLLERNALTSMDVHISRTTKPVMCDGTQC